MADSETMNGGKDYQSSGVLAAAGTEVSGRRVAHTPGPWRVKTDGASNYRAEVVRISPRGKEQVVARLPRLDHGTPEATAALIAASPDLLRELKNLVRLLEPALNNGEVPGLATLNAAWLAIARAEGKDQTPANTAARTPVNK